MSPPDDPEIRYEFDPGGGLPRLRARAKTSSESAMRFSPRCRRPGTGFRRSMASASILDPGHHGRRSAHFLRSPRAARLCLRRLRVLSDRHRHSVPGHCPRRTIGAVNRHLGVIIPPCPSSSSSRPSARRLEHGGRCLAARPRRRPPRRGRAALRVERTDRFARPLQKLTDPAVNGRFAPLPKVRRLSGGGAILHDRELTYSLAVPAEHPLARDPTGLYSLVHDRIIAVLAAMGVESRMRGEARPVPSRSSASAGAIRGTSSSARTRFSASACCRRRGAILQHETRALAQSSSRGRVPRHRRTHRRRLDLARPVKLLAIEFQSLLGSSDRRASLERDEDAAVRGFLERRCGGAAERDGSLNGPVPVSRPRPCRHDSARSNPTCDGRRGRGASPSPPEASSMRNRGTQRATALVEPALEDSPLALESSRVDLGACTRCPRLDTPSFRSTLDGQASAGKGQENDTGPSALPTGVPLDPGFMSHRVNRVRLRYTLAHMPDCDSPR